MVSHWGLRGSYLFSVLRAGVKTGQFGVRGGGINIFLNKYESVGSTLESVGKALSFLRRWCGEPGGFPSNPEVKNPPAVRDPQERCVHSLCPEDPLEEGMQPTPVFLPGESMNRGAWWATVHRVAKSQIRLK